MPFKFFFYVYNDKLEILIKKINNLFNLLYKNKLSILNKKK